MLELVRAMTGSGRTVVLCTHLLAEADGLADEVVVLEQGTAVATGAPASLAAGFWPHPQVWFRAERASDLDRLAAWPGVVGYRRQQERAVVDLDDAGRVAELIMGLSRDGVRLVAVEPHRPTLEELYFAIQASRRAAPPAGSPGGAPAPALAGEPAAPPPVPTPTPTPTDQSVEVGR